MLDPILEAALSGPFTTDKVVAKLLNISPRTACRLLDSGRLEGVKLGALRRFQTAPLRRMAGLPATIQQQAA